MMANKLITLLSFAASSVRLNFTAWDHRNMCFPQTLTQPITVDKVVMIVQRANAARGQVKVYGAGHSFSPCVLTDPISTSLRPDMLTGNLGKLAKVITLPTKSHPVVHVEAGIRVHDLNDQLHAAGFAL